MLPTLIPVRVTALALFESEVVAELLQRVLAGGLVLGGDMTWFASQEELDTPHLAFRLSPR